MEILVRLSTTVLMIRDGVFFRLRVIPAKPGSIPGAAPAGAAPLLICFFYYSTISGSPNVRRSAALLWQLFQLLMN